MTGVARHITDALVQRTEELDVEATALVESVEIFGSEVDSASGTIKLEVVVFNAVGDGPTTIIQVDDYSDNVATAATSIATVSVAVSVAVTVSSSIAATSAASVVAATTSTVVTTTTTTAATSTAGATAGATTGGASSVGAGGGGASSATSGSGASQGPPMMQMVLQIQFLTATSYQAGQYPQGFRSLGKTFAWATLNAGFPNKPKDPTTTRQDGTKSLKFQLVEDLPSYLRWTPEELLVNTLVALGVAMVALGLVLLVWTAWKSLRWAQPGFLQGSRGRLKIASLGARILHISYFGVTFAALNTLKNGSSPSHIALASIALSLITLGLPLLYLVVYVHNRKLAPWLTDRNKHVMERIDRIVKPLMADFKPSHQWFILAVLARLFTMCMGLVMFANSQITQSYHMLFAYAVYFALVGVRPYASRIVFFIDMLMCGVDCLTLTIPLLIHYYPNLLSNSAVIQWVALGLQVSVIVLYMVYASVLLIRQLQIVLTRANSSDSKLLNLWKSKGLVFEVSDSEDSEDDAPHSTKCRPSSDFPMEPRHRHMWDKILRSVDVCVPVPTPPMDQQSTLTTMTEVEMEVDVESVTLQRHRTVTFS